MSINLTGTNDDVEATDSLAREVPDNEQMSRGSLAMAWYGVVSAMFFVYIGAALAVGYGTINALVGLALAIVVFGVINSVITKYAIRNRTTVAQFSRTILGSGGSAIATIIFALVAIYYAVFEGSIVAFAFQTAFGGEWWMWVLVVVLYSTPLIIGGVRRFLDKLNGWLLPLYWGGLIVAVIWASVQYGVTDKWLTQAPDAPLPIASGGPGWLATFAAYLGVMILMMFTMDYASLGKKSDEKFHRTVTFGWVFYLFAYGLNAIVGIFLTFTIAGAEVSETGVAGGLVSMMGIWGLILVWVSQTRINTANYYLGAANLKAFFDKLFRRDIPGIIFVIASSVIIFLLMLLPIVQYILVALAWQGVFVTAWVGIAVVHILKTKANKGESGTIPDSQYRAVNGAGLTAWIVATVTGFIFLNIGPVGATWGPIVTTLVAAVFYAIMYRGKTALKV